MLIDSQKAFAIQIVKPVVEFFLFKLNQYQMRNNHKTLCFVTREGYYLKQLYDRVFRKADKCSTRLIYSSRHIATRLLNGDVDGYLTNLKLHRFKGTVKEFVKYRLNLRVDCADDTIVNTEYEIEPFLQVFDKFESELFTESIRLSKEMLCQLPNGRITAIDFGVHGTVQKSLNELDKSVAGFYLVGSKNNFWQLNEYDYCFVEEEIQWGRLGAIMESIFTAPFGTVYDLKDGNVIFDELSAQSLDVIFRDQLINFTLEAILNENYELSSGKNVDETLLKNRLIQLSDALAKNRIAVTQAINKHLHFENAFINSKNQKILKV